MVIVLQGAGPKLELEVGERDWTRCSLQDGSRVYLGGEERKRLAGRLLKGIGELEGKPIGELAGHKVHWILSLNDAHCSLYAAQRESVRLLIWQNAKAEAIGTIELSDVQRAEWRSQLESLSH